MTIDEVDELCINAIRMLSIDAVQRASSGHPGMPMGAATIAYILWSRHLRHNPRNPSWPDRDRFVLSAGHASMLLYSLLYLTGYDLTMSDIKQFRKWNSRTPGHPERGRTPGVEVTTGPLGQGVANGVGLAIAERWLAATFNRPGADVVNHYTYVLASDGDMMEGVAAEAASLAGTLRLGRLIVVYDANLITLSATTNLTFSEDVIGRFEAYGWHVQRIDGQDPIAVDMALTTARDTEDRPSLIVARTHIGYGSPHKQDTWHAHGEPLGVEEVRLTKRALGWPDDGDFYVPEDARRRFELSITRGEEMEAAWQRRVNTLETTDPAAAAKFAGVVAGELPDGWDAHLPVFSPGDGEMATRDAAGLVLNALAINITNLVGGSADLDPSTRTAMKGFGDFESPAKAYSSGELPTQGTAGGVWGYAGRNIHFGLREHAMAAVMTGMALHDGLLPYGATFLSFSDYMRPSIRLAALSKAHVIYIWTHDSIALGEDGPTHQPVEQLASLRAMPNMMIIRPSDATETVEAWRAALLHAGGPVGLVLTRHKLPVLDRTLLASSTGLAQGAYILAEAGESPPEVILIATGSEVSLALQAHAQLAGDGIRSRVVSMPCWELFERQPESYRDTVLPPSVRARVSIEAAAPFGWERYVGLDGAMISVADFGASAPGPVVMREFGFTPEHVIEAAKQVLQLSRLQ
ncbi:MAG TPA: transketolase [Vicinamibacterales bacterium]|nr:transketolase [Vicinamibacterales bacterium]